MIIGFIGLGRMGRPMCLNIIRKSGHEVVVYDLNPDSVRACTDEGALEGASVADVSARADVIFTSLPMPADVDKVALGPAGIEGNARSGSVLIDLSTNAPDGIRKLGEQLQERGISVLDAPVSGGIPGATKGTLAIMVGGDKQIFDDNLALLECAGSNVTYIGELGSGQLVKIINNMLCIAGTAAAAEGLMLGAMAGLNIETLDKVIRASSGDSIAYREISKRVLARDHGNPEFTLDLAYKDAALFLSTADRLSVPVPSAHAAHNLMRMAKGSGWGGLNDSVVMKVYETALNHEI